MNISILKRTILLSLTIALSLTALNAAPEKVKTKKSFDKGWWWYEETYKDPETKKEETIKYKMSPMEKAKLDKEEKTNKLLKILISEQVENKKVNKAKFSSFFIFYYCILYIIRLQLASKINKKYPHSQILLTIIS